MQITFPFFVFLVSRQIVHVAQVAFVVAIFPEKCLHSVYTAPTFRGLRPVSNGK
jgi:hypothetical protein